MDMQMRSNLLLVLHMPSCCDKQQNVDGIKHSEFQAVKFLISGIKSLLLLHV